MAYGRQDWQPSWKQKKKYAEWQKAQFEAGKGGTRYNDEGMAYFPGGHPSSMYSAGTDIADTFNTGAYWMYVASRIGLGTGYRAEAQRLKESADKLLKKLDMPFITSIGDKDLRTRWAEKIDKKIAESGIPQSSLRGVRHMTGRVLQDRSGMEFAEDIEYVTSTRGIIEGTVRGTASDIVGGAQAVGRGVMAPFKGIAWLWKWGPWMLGGILVLSLAGRAVQRRRASRNSY